MNKMDNVEDIFLFALNDDAFIEKYELLSAMWARLIHLGPCKIHVAGHGVFMRIFNDNNGAIFIRDLIKENAYVFSNDE